MTQTYAIPTRRISRLYGPRSAEYLEQYLTPVQEARTEDVVAISIPLSWEQNRNYIQVLPEVEFIVRYENGWEIRDVDYYVRHKYTDQLEKLGALALCLFNDSYIISTAGPGLKDAKVNGYDSVEGHAFCFPRAMVVIADDIANSMDQTEERSHTQQNLHKLLSLVIPETSSAHEDMQAMQWLSGILDFATEFASLYEDDEKVLMTLPPRR